MAKRDFIKSYEIFETYKDQNRVNDMFGNCVWQIEHDDFLLECWNVIKLKGPRIYQIWPDGNGFSTWQ